MNSNSWFKLIIYFVNWVKLSLISFPIAAAIITFKQGKVKYGYDFLTVDHNWSIIIAIGIGLVLNTWHAIAFENEGNLDPKQYLKMRQRFIITNSKWSLDVYKTKLKSLLTNKDWTLLSEDPGSIKLLIKSRFGQKDIVTLTPTDSGIEIYSRPKSPIAIVDMARNLSNVKVISKKLKEL